MERQRKIGWRVYSVDDSVHCDLELDFQPRRPPTLEEHTEVWWTEVNRLRQEILPPQPPPQYDLSPLRSSTRSSPQQRCSSSRVVTDKGAVEPEGDDQDKRGEFPLEEQVGTKKKIKGNMKPERASLELLSVGTGVKALEQPRLSCSEMRPTTVGNYRHADARDLEQGGYVSLKSIFRG